MKTVEDFIREAKHELSALYQSAEADAVLRLLIEEVLGFSAAGLVARKTTLLDPAQEKKLVSCIGQLKLNKPVQYVLGTAWFAGMKFRVDENVLIPRPETEELCEWISNGNFGKGDGMKILDIGTGSGCIAIALKKKFPKASVLGIDRSAGALRLARENATLNKVEVGFAEADMLATTISSELEEKFDLIVSNPPYIQQREMALMNSRVTAFEPHMALFVSDDDPLIFYRAIASFANDHLKPAGEMYFEINEALGTAVAELLLQHGFNSELKKDLSGKTRMVRARHLLSAKVS